MAGRIKGVQSVIKTKYPKALYVHCAAHSLNLVVSSASDLQPIQNCLAIIEKTHVFFNTPKRNNVLQHEIENSDILPNVKTLKRLCATRWIQRYDAVNDFIELLTFVINALQKIVLEWKDSSSTDADMLKKAITESEFLISLYVIKVSWRTNYYNPLCFNY